MTSDVFVPRKPKAKPHRYAGCEIGVIMGHKSVDGEIGIEIEVEGNKFPKGEGSPHGPYHPELIPHDWRYTHDGSLRGDDNAEYVLRQPINFSEVPAAIGRLWNMFEDFGSVLAESNRTSVHVHLNVQSWHLNRLAAFTGMYFAVEEMLTEWCGEHRVGNLFCLRAKDAPNIITQIKRYIQNDGQWELSNGLHYSGLNVGALRKFGSIEIRSLRGVNDPETILDWVAVLERLYKLSADYEDPRLVVSGFSGAGPVAWAQNILGPHYYTIVQSIGWDTERVRTSLYEGIRLAQDICYCRDWSEYEPKVLKRDPFGKIEEPITPNEMASTVNGMINSHFASTFNTLSYVVPVGTLPMEGVAEDSEEYFPEWDEENE